MSAETNILRHELAEARRKLADAQRECEQLRKAGDNLAAELCQWCPHEMRGAALTQWDNARDHRK